jgi:hypothetical protein
VGNIAKRVSIPILQLFLMILAFGLQAGRLGFYIDDWLIINAYNTGGVQRLMQYTYLDNRPLVFWTWWAGFKLLGSSALAWQLWALFWRWLTCAFLWICLRKLWPHHGRETALTALLFSVYPIFIQQATALTFTFHWISYCFYLLSLWLMILFIQAPKRRFLYLAGALFIDAAQLFSQEFFVGLELLRPLVIWLVLQPVAGVWQAKVKTVVKKWAPFLGLLVVYALWRLILMPRPGADRNAPASLYSLFTHPLSAAPQWIMMAIQDFVEGLFGTWYKTYQPASIAYTPISNLLSWMIVVLAAAILLVLFFRTTSQEESQGSLSSPWYRSAGLFGLAAMLLGFLPGWAIGGHIADPTGAFNDKFGLAAMFGAAILLTALISLAVRNIRTLTVIIVILTSLATGFQFRNETQYRWSWEMQTRFYWQLKWRAPQIEASTAIIGNNSLGQYMGSWANAAAVNQMYAPYTFSEKAGYWYFDVADYPLADVQDKKINLVKAGKNYLQFAGGTQQTLVVEYNPEDDRCLWVLSDQDRYNPYLDPNIKSALPLSDLNRIQPVDTSPLATQTFGNEPKHDWCYFFEKGDLAVQLGDWQGAVNLWKQAQAQGYRPGSVIEYTPFILAAAHIQDWTLAIKLTGQADFPNYEMHDDLCTTWRQILQETPETPGRGGAIQEINAKLDCRTILGM